MLKHIVLFRLKDECTDAERQELVAGLWSLADDVREIRDLAVGPAVNKTGWDLALLATFDDVAAYGRYGPSEPHQRVVTSLVRPLVAELATAQLEVP